MNFSSLLDRFPNPLPRDFMIREAIGPCTVEFCDIERKFRERMGWTRFKIVAFFDELDTQIAVIYSGRECYIDKGSDSMYGKRVTPAQFFDFMLAEYPSIAEWLLWNL